MTNSTPTQPLNNSSPREKGVAMIIMMLIIVLGLIGIFTYRLDRKGPGQNADRQTAAALVQAKEALLGNSATNNIAGGTPNPGSMPCPDQDNDGGWGKNTLPPPATLSYCPAGVNFGRLPWAFLSIDDIRDGATERLWIVVDPAFIDKGNPINSLNPSPTLLVDGKAVVVAIISPGAPISGQNRIGANVYIPNNYLESFSSPIVSAPSSPIYNDRILTISANEVFSVVTFRMARELAKAAGDPPYPYTPPVIYKIADLLPKPLVWVKNNWDAAVDQDGVVSKFNAASITLKFLNCNITYYITGKDNVSRDRPFC